MGQTSLQVNCRQTGSRSPGLEVTSPFTAPPRQPPPPVPRKQGSACTQPGGYQVSIGYNTYIFTLFSLELRMVVYIR